MKLSIRPLAAGDHAAWLPLWQGYNAFYGRPEMPDDITRSAWERFMAPDVPMQALGAFEGGRLIGIAHYLYHPSTTATRPSCYMQDLFTVPEARGKGVGKALIEAVYAAATTAGAARVYWQTHETNQTAMRLYDLVAEKSGFVVYRKLL